MIKDPSIRWQRQMDFYTFKATLVYIVSSRTAREILTKIKIKKESGTGVKPRTSHEPEAL